MDAAAKAVDQLRRRPLKGHDAFRFMIEHEEYWPLSTKNQFDVVIHEALSTYNDKADPDGIKLTRFWKFVSQTAKPDLIAESKRAKVFALKDFYNKNMHWIFNNWDFECKCGDQEGGEEGMKERIIMDTIDFHGKELRAVLGAWLKKIINGENGRENAVLLYGIMRGTGKTTILNSLMGWLQVDQLFQPLYRGGFPFNGYDSARVRALFLNEFRCAIAGLDAPSMLAFLEADRNFLLDQKFGEAVHAIDPYLRFPIAVLMTTNYWREEPGWKSADINAMCQRFLCLHELTKKLPRSFKNKTPKTFCISDQCPLCSYNICKKCVDAFGKHPKYAAPAMRHCDSDELIEDLRPNLVLTDDPDNE